MIGTTTTPQKRLYCYEWKGFRAVRPLIGYQDKKRAEAQCEQANWQRSFWQKILGHKWVIYEVEIIE